MTTFCWADTSVVCNTTTLSHGAIYGTLYDDDEAGPAPLAADPSFIGAVGEPPRSKELELTLRWGHAHITRHVFFIFRFPRRDGGERLLAQ